MPPILKTAALLGASLAMGLPALAAPATPGDTAMRVAQLDPQKLIKCAQKPDSPDCRGQRERSHNDGARERQPARAEENREHRDRNGRKRDGGERRNAEEGPSGPGRELQRRPDRQSDQRPERRPDRRPEREVSPEKPPQPARDAERNQRREGREDPRRRHERGDADRRQEQNRDAREQRQPDGRRPDARRPDGRDDNARDHRRPEQNRPERNAERDRERQRDGDRPREGERSRDRNHDWARDHRRRDGDRDRDWNRERPDDRQRDRHRDRRRPDRDRALEFSLPIPGVGGRVIIRDGGNVTVRSDDDARFSGRRSDRDVRRLSGGRTETVIRRGDGSAVITVRNSDGDILRRVRRAPNGREIVLIDNERSRRPDRPLRFDPLRLDIPRDRYIVEGAPGRRDIVEEALRAPAVEPVERAYSLHEIRRNERLRAKMRRVDLSLTFAFDSAAIPGDQYDALEVIAGSINDELDRNPGDVFLIEGHTDAPGSYDYNLRLSDARAESVAIALSEYFAIPPENLVTQGYGEEYLKIDTLERERRNRRVTIRRITPLLEGQR